MMYGGTHAALAVGRPGDIRPSALGPAGRSTSRTDLFRGHPIGFSAGSGWSGGRPGSWSVGVFITGKDSVELSSGDGRVKVVIAAGSVSIPVFLRYQESGLLGTSGLDHGYTSTGRPFDLSAEPDRPDDGPVEFLQKLAITVGIGPKDLISAGNDYSRFALQHYLEREQAWEVLDTTSLPATSDVVAQVDSLSRFTLTIGPASERDANLPAARPEAVLPAAAPEASTPAPLSEPSPTAPVATVPLFGPAPTATHIPTPVLTEVQVPTVTLPPAATPIPVATATSVPTPKPVPVPAPIGQTTITPIPATAKLNGFRLYINGLLVQAGQTSLAILNGKVVLPRPPDDETRLTNGLSADYTPACSPSGSQIAYTSAADGNDEIYVMNADGSGKQRLTDSGALDNYPAWSPDGSKIAFVSDRDGNQEIYVMNSDGTGLANLTNDPGGDTTPAWSPSGGKIAFSSNRNGSWEIYLMNSDGSVPHRLTDNNASDSAPSWNAAGSQLVFHTNRDGNHEVYRMSSDGSFQTKLTSEPSTDSAADWER